jgi:hypothetical protein
MDLEPSHNQGPADGNGERRGNDAFGDAVPTKAGIVS